jgi:hypothetical protein
LDQEWGEVHGPKSMNTPRTDLREAGQIRI